MLALAAETPPASRLVPPLPPSYMAAALRWLLRAPRKKLLRLSCGSAQGGVCTTRLWTEASAGELLQGFRDRSGPAVEQSCDRNAQYSHRRAPRLGARVVLSCDAREPWGGKGPGKQLHPTHLVESISEPKMLQGQNRCCRRCGCRRRPPPPA